MQVPDAEKAYKKLMETVTRVGSLESRVDVLEVKKPKAKKKAKK